MFNELDFNLDHIHIVDKDVDQLINGKDEDYVTHVGLVLPIKRDEFREGIYEVAYKEQKIEVRLQEVKGVTDDLIIRMGRGWRPGAGKGFKAVPFDAFADNRGRYPCFYAHLLFPYRLANWANPNLQREGRFYMTGEERTGPLNELDKIEALKVLNILFSDESYPARIKPLEYEDVTAFIETYFSKNNPAPILRRLTALASRHAFRDSVVEYSLGPNIKGLSGSLAGLAAQYGTEGIEGESGLKGLLLSVIGKIRQDIEDRHRWQPFWEGSRTIVADGKKISIEKSPKTEVNIQPTLHILLTWALSPFGIHVVKEMEEGSLDFKCVYLTKSGTPVNAAVSFKLAHNTGIKKGIAREFPDYLRAIRSGTGIFIVIWFKDAEERFFREPKTAKSEMIDLIDKTAQETGKKEGLSIEAVLIDASISQSGSK